MNKWVWIWTVWLLSIAVSFAIFEDIGWNKLTLSRYVWDFTSHWPLAIYLWGNLTGGLAVHFWWHWSPPGSTNEG
jgi:hypothetical protein